jgi:hypothetical protein
MNQIKTQLAALALLDRSFNAATDEELAALLATLPTEGAEAVAEAIGVADLADGKAVMALRLTASQGRVSGVLAQLGMALTDGCLADCVDQLGDSAENPTEDELRTVSHALIEKHNVGTVRLMLASAIVGEAPASVACIHLLKSDDLLALPAISKVTGVAPAAPTAEELAESEALRLRRKGDKDRKKAAERARTAQAAAGHKKRK